MDLKKDGDGLQESNELSVASLAVNIARGNSRAYRRQRQDRVIVRPGPAHA